MEIEITLSPNEMQYLKYSIDPIVRDKYFETFSNSCKDANLPVVLETCNLRKHYATELHESQNFYKF